MSPTGESSSSPLPRNLINASGEPFATDLLTLEASLTTLDNPQRELYRDSNASAIATHAAARLLIVAGPGAGKSFLFLSRIKYWLPLDDDALIYVSSFVRRLVKDLRDDVERALSDAEQGRVTVTTLHGLARSLLERSHGTSDQPLRPHIKVITEEWKAVVWSDVREFYFGLRASRSVQALEMQFHTEELDDDPQWVQLRYTYFTLTQFYNAVGFADMVVLACQAVDENPDLNEHLFWIVDEGDVALLQPL
jgi:superfamily I DNA/RNA helicase